MGPLITADAVEDMFKALEQAEAEGGQVLFGARRRLEIGTQFVEPTIVRMPSQTGIVKTGNICADSLHPGVRELR